MTPQLFRADLFKTSGHYFEFHDDMFWFEGDEGEELGVKAMNCPGHCRLYQSAKRSYRDLPIRFAEFSRLHRNERSGTLTGLSRVRAMAQDDAHIYCEPDDVPAEIERFFAMTAEVYRDLRLSGVKVSVSTRPERFLGEAFAGRSDRVVIATKFGNDMQGANGDRPGGSRAYVRRAIDASLIRLGVDHIDLYYYHRPDGVTPLDVRAALAHAAENGQHELQRKPM